MSSPPPPQAVVVLGVSGSGKSTVGRALADVMSYDFCDADDLHSAANIEKMSSGRPLTDEDRLPWLRLVGQKMLDTLNAHEGVVMACSALKKMYRDIIREYVHSTFFVMLEGSPQLILTRVESRRGSFMPPSLLSSQFATLEPLESTESGVRVDIAPRLELIVDQVVVALAHRESPGGRSYIASTEMGDVWRPPGDASDD